MSDLIKDDTTKPAKTGYDFLDMPDDQWADQNLGPKPGGLIDEVVTQGLQGNPQETTDAVRLGKTYDVPPDEAVNALPALKKREKLDAMDVKNLPNKYPALTKAMVNNPALSALFASQMPVLKDFEDSLKPGAASNFVRNAAGRVATLANNAISFIDTLAKPVISDQMDSLQSEDRLNAFLSGNTYKPVAKPVVDIHKTDTESAIPVLDEAKKLLGDDFGYVPTHTWETTKKEFSDNGAFSPSAWGEVGAYAFESFGASAVDMAAMVFAMPAYIGSRTQEMGEERAKNKGIDRATPQELMEAAPAVLGSVLMDKLGLDKMLGVGKGGAEAVGKEALQYVLKKAAAATGVEMTTEFFQEGVIEYLGEKLGTDADMSVGEAFDRGLGGAVAAGPTSLAMSGAAGAVNMAMEKKQADYLQGAVEEINESIAAQSNLDVLTEKAEALNQASPEARDALFQQMRDEYPDLPTEVFIDPRDLQEAISLSDLPTTEYSLEEALQDDMLERIDSAGFDDVRVSLEEYLTLGYALDENIRSNVRLTEGGLSLNDIEAAPEAQGNVIQRMTAEAEKNIELKDESEKIFQEVQEQLKDTGKFTARESKLQAQLFPAYIATKAARSKQDYGVELSVSELWEKMSFGGVTVGDMRKQVTDDKAVLSQATEQGYEGTDKGEAVEWVNATEKFGAEGMTTEARLSRAKEQGFDTETVLYHGTNKEFEGFDLSEFGQTDEGFAGKGVYFTNAPEFAEEYGGTLIPTYAKLQTPLIVDSYDKINDAAGVQRARDLTGEKSKIIRDNLMAKGYDGILIEDFDANGVPVNEYVIFDPSQIRSVNAAFDPDQSDSANLLAQTSQNNSNDLTQTPEFKNWFGESKAVDENGAPLVVHHGTASNFEVFEESEQGKVTGAESAKNAIFFTDDKATADAYAVYAAEDAPVKEAMRKADEAEARDDWDAYDQHLEEAERLEGEAFELRKNAKVLNTYLKMDNPLTVDAGGLTPQDLSENDNVDSWLSNQIQAAKDAGHDGLIMQNLDDAVGLYDRPSNHYVVFDSKQIKSVENSGDFNPDNPSILNQDEGNNQGSFDLNTRVINLSKASNRSTFLHESFHLFTEFEKQLANEYGLTENNKAMLDYVGMTSFDELDINTHEGVEGYEKLAQSFEQYAMEGKAPSPALRDAFRAFKDWLLIIYKRLVSNRVAMNNDIRGVFDRMLAVDTEIRAANAEFNYEHDTPATAKAKESLEEKLLKEYERKSEQWWKNETASLEKLALDELAEERVYKVYDFIRDNKLDEQLVGEILGYKLQPQSKELDPKVDSLVVAIGKLGGVDRKEASDQGIDPANWSGKKNVNNSYGVGRMPFKKSGGSTFDAMAENLSQYGYLDAEGMPLDPNSLLDAVEGELAGDNTYSREYDYGDMFEDEYALPAKPKRLYGTTTKNGASPEMVALANGYPSADVMLREIANTESIQVAAKEQAENEMIDKYGDILRDGTLQAMALEEIHNTDRGRELLKELKAIGKKESAGINTDMLKTSAANIVSDMVIGDIKPAQYLRKEKKASIEHAKLKEAGDTEGAIQAKMDQLINFYLYKEATQAKVNAEKWRKYSREVQTREYKPGQVSAEYIHYMKLYSSLFELRKQNKDEADQATEKLITLSKWIQAQQETNPEGYAPQFLDENLTLLQDPNFDASTVELKSWDTMTVGELRGVRDQLKHFRFIGGKLSDEAKAERLQITERLESTTLKNSGKKTRNKEGRGKIKQTVDWVHENQLGLRNHVDQLDGDQTFGTGSWFRDFYKPYVLDPTDKWVTIQGDLVNKVKDILGPTSSEMGYEDSLTNRVKTKAGQDIGLRTVKTEFGDWTLMRRERIMFGLYFGSPETRKTLLEVGGVPQVQDSINADGEIEYDLSFGHPVTMAQAQEMLNHLTAEDVKIIEDIWALNESIRPESFQVQRNIAGVVPPAVDHIPFTVNGKQLAGGYMRTYYERSGSEIKDDIDLATESIAMAGMSGTKSGALIERVGSGGKRISYDMNNITRALSEQAQFIAFAEASADASRILNDKKVTNAIVDRYGKEKLESLRNATKGVYLGADAMSAEGNAHLAQWLSKWRQNLSMATLGYAPKNIIQQPVAATQIISDVGLPAYLRAIGDFARDRETWTNYVDSRDPKVNFRMKTLDREVMENNSRLGNSAANNAFQENAYIFQTMIDKAMGYPAWVAYHRRGLAKFQDLDLTDAEIDERATEYAAERLADSLGSGLMKDMAPLFSGMSAKTDATARETLKFMTAFGSFFNTTYRKFGTAYRESDGSFQDRIEFARKYMWLMFIPAVIGAIPVDDMPEDDEDWFEWLVKTQAKYSLASIMFVRNIAGLALSGFSGKSQDAAAVKSAVDLATMPYDLAFGDKELSDPEVWSGSLKALSVFVRLPGAGSVDRAVKGLNDDEQGIYAGIVEGKEYQTNEFKWSD